MAQPLQRLRECEDLILLFGCQSLSFDQHLFSQLRTRILARPHLSWIVDSIRGLPGQWETLVKRIPRLQTRYPHGAQLLSNLTESFTSGTISSETSILANIVLTPLVVITHLVEYDTFQNIKGRRWSQQSCILGLCTGLLSALAVSASRDQEEFARKGRAVISLAMFVGAIVDGQDQLDLQGSSQSLATAWTSQNGLVDLQNTLSTFKESYLSVAYDSNRATVTVAKNDIVALRDQLRSAGITAHELGLFGRFHTSLHQQELDDLIAFCETDAELNVQSSYPVGASDGNGSTATVLRAILTDQATWFETVSSARNRHPAASVVLFGTEKCIPPSHARALDSEHLIQMSEIQNVYEDAHSPDAGAQLRPGASPNDIAVVGVGCKFANADDMDELWQVLLSGQSQHIPVPTERFSMDTVFRTDATAKRKWYGNFMRDPDAFDHKFFHKSPREASSMDPQQRQVLQAAYQALEQSGYFARRDRNPNVGCYVGVVSTDYQHNIACHEANAYTATGNLTSFIAGKISHYFGWTGPALTIDTACSSSAVAIHQACRAILSGDCDAAIAGGALVITSPLWFHNLAGASFLSPTGSCKPFDKDADGYCRGEGVATVMLKRMSAAVADGDAILGCIASTDVRQNENCTPIVVPNTPSLSSLFQRVLTNSGLNSNQVSAVEAHGTGTPVGDPAEWSSIRDTFGGKQGRSQPLYVGSVKGHIGHTECTSGVAALIKVLLMIQSGVIPPQASHTALSPLLKSTPNDHMEVTTRTRSWEAAFRAALINNYGASGSNASMIVTQPFRRRYRTSAADREALKLRVPIWISGHDDAAVARNARATAKWLRQASQHIIATEDVAFALSKRINTELDSALAFTASGKDDLIAQLEAVDSIYNSSGSKQRSKPVILCFGGQISKWVGLDRAVFDRYTLLRRHLNTCDKIVQDLGQESIFPGIFERTEILDPVKLQSMLFSLQYACAQSWIDSGVKPVAAVGHSFGELVAMSICGVVSLEDAIKIVLRRATVIRDRWESERGAMMAAEASHEDIKSLLASAAELARAENETPATVACYNSATSYTLAGSAKAIEAVTQVAVRDSLPVKLKPLNVTHAFHSTLIDNLLGDLRQITDGITFHDAKIPLMHSTQVAQTRPLAEDFIAKHLRNPVYFHHAVERLAAQFPSAVWLEAGSASTITNMASRALAVTKDSHDFVSMNITNGKTTGGVAEATLFLWKAGHWVQYWAHHASQAYEYPVVFPPPYQFANTKFWLKLEDPPVKVEVAPPTAAPPEEALPTKLWSFIDYQDSSQRTARFRMNTHIEAYKTFLDGHLIAQEAPICPATVMLDVVIEALRSIHEGFGHGDLVPILRDVKNEAPVCRDPARTVWLDLESVDQSRNVWNWRIFSTGKSTYTHVVGQVVLRRRNDEELQLDFARFERLVGYHRCQNLLNDSQPDDLIYGRNIYRAFADVVDYSEMYRGLQKLVGKGSESAARIEKAYDDKSWFDAVLTDCFSQTGGVWVNCMANESPNTLYIANAIEQWIRSPRFNQSGGLPTQWDAFATHKKVSDKAYCTDVFVFDATTGELLEVILGINYAQVPRATMRKILARNSVSDLPNGEKPTEMVNASVSSNVHAPSPPIEKSHSQNERPAAAKKQKASKPAQKAGIDVIGKLKEILAELTGLGVEEIDQNADLGDIGVDSLMAMELMRELERGFKCAIPEDEAMEITTFPQLVQFMSRLAGAGDSNADQADDDTDTGSETNDQKLSPSTTRSRASSATSVDKDEVESKQASEDLHIPSSVWQSAFQAMNSDVDKCIADCGFANYLDTANPRQTELCVAMICEAFTQLDCDLRELCGGQTVKRVEHIGEQTRLVDYLYYVLDTEAGLVKQRGNGYVRTEKPVPTTSSAALLQELNAAYPSHADATDLAYWCGSRLADVVQGRENGVKLIFGSERGRDLVSKLYGQWPLNKMYYQRMVVLLQQLIAQLPRGRGPLRILEMGSGTAGTTKILLPALAEIGFPVQYTFTDLSPSFVAAARKQFKQYSFLQFQAHDIEKEPAANLLASQHLVVASNAVHATHDLDVSTANIRKALRPDGALLMLEMTSPVIFIDIIFGLFEGWWLFNDGRRHAISSEHNWDRVLRANGYGHVAWTNGQRAEHRIEKLILALAESGHRYAKEEEDPIPATLPDLSADLMARQAAIDTYVRTHTSTWSPLPPVSKGVAVSRRISGDVVLITGATGSLGSHLVAACVARSNVASVICLNRPSRMDPLTRQREALTSRGLALTATELAKIQAYEGDTSRPGLGLSADAYADVAREVTHICHNAWPMSARRDVSGFEAQFRVMRHLLDLASASAAAAVASGNPRLITFELVSSIAVVGHYPLWTGAPVAPEERVDVRSVLPNGYGDAKFVCERMLDATLHQHPTRFRATVVRPGQIAGSKQSGSWNTAEHLSFLVKSCQTLGVLPALQGPCSWTPVDDVAGTAVDVMMASNTPQPIYHIDNPVRQPWEEMIPLLADALALPRSQTVSFEEWLRRVREFPGSAHENPAIKLIDFLESNFVRMSCGGLLLGTQKAVRDSETMARVGPVTADQVNRYIQSWKASGFLA